MKKKRKPRKNGGSSEREREIFTPYITKKGRVIWHPTGGVFHFFVKEKAS